MTIQEQVAIIGNAFRQGLHEILGGKLVGAYIYGAAAFPDAVPTGDIDFHVILAEPLAASERSALEALHEDLGRRFPPLGVDMDGYYLLLEDARGTSPPRSQMWARAVDTSWALHREHIRAGRCIVLQGPEPAEIYPPASWPEIEGALVSELAYVEKHLREYPDYCILNLCRLVYSFQTRDVVVSKAAAAEWAREALPAWRRAVEVAMATYPGQATPEERGFLLAEAEGLLTFARARIEACR
jgi:hypothetical protein